MFKLWKNRKLYTSEYHKNINTGKYPVNPETFKIINNKLYLFYKDNGYNFLEIWESNEKVNLEKANERWKVINGNN